MDFLSDAKTGMAIRDGVVVATVKLPPVGDTIVLMAHELQHVIGLTRGLDLKAEAGRRGSGVWKTLGGYETRLCCRAHAKISSSGAVFEKRDYAFTLSHPAIPEVTLHYTTFGDLTDDIDDARVYGGIHFRFDQEAGARQGRRVGAYVYAHNFRRLRRDTAEGR